MDPADVDAAALERHTTLYAPRALRAMWPDDLARLWLEAYPGLFDEDDLRQTITQRAKHFYEWFTAVHIFQREGSLSLVEKYAYSNHPRKQRIVSDVIPPDQWAVLDDIRSGGVTGREVVQLPDLLVIRHDQSFYFAEIKGPTDRLRPKQAASHQRIIEKLGVAVEIVNVVLTDGLAGL